MKKTLFVMFDFPPRFGGAQRFNWDMVRALPSDKAVIVAPRWGEWREFDKRSGYNTYRLPWGWMEKLKIPILPFAVFYLALREGVERIWFSKYSKTLYFTTLITSNLQRLPFGLTVFGEDLAWAAEDSQVRLPRFALWLRDSAVRKARRIVANSCYSGSLLPPGVEFSVIHPCASENSRLGRVSGDAKTVDDDFKPVTFLSVGTLTRKKGFDLVIRALAAGLPGVPRFRYLIAGTGPEEQSLRTLAGELGVTNVVQFLGCTSDETKDGLYRCADVFVMPSRIEGFGMVFLEAASSGLCSVSSRAGGIPEAIDDGKTGILVDPENVEELRQALTLLGRDKALRQRMGKAARGRCAERFCWERFAKEWVPIFEATW